MKFEAVERLTTAVWRELSYFALFSGCAVFLPLTAITAYIYRFDVQLRAFLFLAYFIAHR